MRQSHRYPGYWRVQTADYQLALIDTIARDGCDLIEAMKLRDTLLDLRARIEQSNEYSALGKLTRGILRNCRRTSPLDARAQEFNLAAEQYYREELRAKHLDEALDFLEEDLRDSTERVVENSQTKESFEETLQGNDPVRFLTMAREDLSAGNPSGDVVARLIRLMLALEFLEVQRAAPLEKSRYEPAPVS